ncbi:FecR domain-containing protein [Bacteroides sp.]|uniref:FecR family protein n=1 Tax=Bacteroides sp. TaxID=29523 RepID=UPI00258D5BC2|nr:FecR domain-containing protein [Bacteroides sp.]
MEKEYYKNLAEKYFAGDITEAEISELAGWIRNNVQLSDWWEEEFEKSDTDTPLALRDKMFARIKAEVLKEQPAMKRTLDKTLVPAWAKWAAMICIPICIAFFTYNILSISNADKNRSPFMVKANKGDKATVVLPDGTDVILNSASQLSYLSDFGRNERRVHLEGEGYFKVAHDARRTFIVQVGELEVKVMGTVFNVCAYSNDQDVTVVLLEGKVGVYTPSTSATLSPGEKINYNKSTRKLSTEKVYPDDYVSWTKGNLYFQNESLENIMKALSRVYDVTIRIDSPKISEERFTGTIPGGGIQNALNIIMLTSPFRYEVEDSVIILKEK